MFVQVAVPVPGLDLLTYIVPDGVRTPMVGSRVVVPLGTRVVTGIVVETNVTPGAEGRTVSGEPRTPKDNRRITSVKSLREVLDADAFVPPDVVALARWTADYYAAGVGDTIPSLLPPMARGGRADAHKTLRVAAITAAGLEALDVEARGSTGSPRAITAQRTARPELVEGSTGSPRAITAQRTARPELVEGRVLSPKQREALEILAGAPAGISTPVLATRGFAADVISRLARHGYVSLRQDRVERNSFQVSDPGAGHPGRTQGSDPGAGHPPRLLTGEQTAALGRLLKMADAHEFRVALVHGVTGSGKTEIYIRLSAAVRAAGRRVLMLVPEIALTPAAASLFRQAFGERVAIQHSGLSDGERHDQWHRIRRGDTDVVVGTRSAVFAPLEQVGLIVVDEEHDGSYKQDESPRYNGRDVAIVRAQQARALVVLGSATPSMESYHNAAIGRYERVILERRVLDRRLASVTVVDMREEYAAEGPHVILGRALRAGMQARLERRGRGTEHS